MRIFTMTGDDDYIYAVFTIKSNIDGSGNREDFSYLNGRLMTPNTWDDNGPCEADFVADVYFKWDCCTHWYFYGEDQLNNPSRRDGYYHLCGTSYWGFVEALGFVADVMKEYFLNDVGMGDELEKFEMLKIKERYTIEEVQGRPDWFNLIYGFDFTDDDLE